MNTTDNRQPSLSTLIGRIEYAVEDAKRELCPYNKTNHENLHKTLLRIAENAKQAIVTNSIYLGK